MPFARVDLIQGKPPEYRAAVADIVYQGIVDVLKAPDGDRFVVVGEHTADNLIYDPQFIGFSRSPDLILIQVTSTVGNNKETKFALYRFVADELKSRLGVRPDDIMINMVLSRRRTGRSVTGSHGDTFRNYLDLKLQDRQLMTGLEKCRRQS